MSMEIDEIKEVARLREAVSNLQQALTKIERQDERRGERQEKWEEDREKELKEYKKEIFTFIDQINTRLKKIEDSLMFVKGGWKGAAIVGAFLVAGGSVLGWFAKLVLQYLKVIGGN